MRVRSPPAAFYLEWLEFMRYLIIQVSGKQLLLKQKEWYDIDYIKNININNFIFFNKIILFKKINKIQIGNPFLNNNYICGKFIQNIKGQKITILKTKPKKKYTRIKSHKPLYTRILIL